ncbi:PilZ domain-containing protein [Stakelama saccharophila]|uniref:PilZ domain-containing protein n=1 Tax=Stakelama saccharophila TaxID=3075605 RepID=A0ABZ0BCT4_9SPHN|nr:PilZ domain-containing protein [Stakelama sp. W311]WNO54491.1 PilZ domain-containing protein [Stakelama sp. W311]
MADVDERRTETRYSMMLSARVEQFGAREPTQHRIRNLSRHGACIDRVDRMQRGQTVLITVGALECVASTVRWTEEARAGLHFATPIDIDAARAKVFVRATFDQQPGREGDRPKFILKR